MNRFVAFLMVIAFSFTNTKASDAAKLHEKAPTCSGYFFILTAISKKEPALGEYFSQRVRVADELTKVYLEVGLKEEFGVKKIKRKQFLQMKAYGTKTAAEQLSKNTSFALTDIKVCLSWLQEVIEYMQPMQKAFEKTPSMQAIALAHPNVPKYDVNRPYRFGNFDELQPVILSAFTEWKNMGSVIPNISLLDALNKTSKKGATVSYSDIEQRPQFTGLFYWKGTETLFSGRVIAKKNSGRIEYEGEILNGKIEGSWTNYWENGEIYGKMKYENGLRHGAFFTFHENGELHQQCRYARGKLDGLCVEFDNAGNKISSITYKNGAIADQ